MLTIRHAVTVHASAERCFDLTRSVDLHVDSSPEIGAQAVGGRQDGLSELGDETTWSARFFGVRFAMTTRIEGYTSPYHFNDRMTNGLLRRFTHVYRFEAQPDGCCNVSDELQVEAPFGFLGCLMERFYLIRKMETLVCLRLERIKAAAEGEEWKRYLPSKL